MGRLLSSSAVLMQGDFSAQRTSAGARGEHAGQAGDNLRRRRLSWPLCGAGAAGAGRADTGGGTRSEEHTSELQSLMRISYAVFCLKKKKKQDKTTKLI